MQRSILTEFAASVKAKRRTFHELNSVSLLRLLKSSTFDLGLTDLNLKLKAELVQKCIIWIAPY